MDGLTEGRIVHYVLNNGEHRPAIVVRVWPDEFGPGVPGVNLCVFLDGTNDARAFDSERTPPPLSQMTYWVTSAKFDQDTKAPRTVHWIEEA